MTKDVKPQTQAMVLAQTGQGAIEAELQPIVHQNPQLDEDIIRQAWHNVREKLEAEKLEIPKETGTKVLFGEKLSDAAVNLSRRPLLEAVLLKAIIDNKHRLRELVKQFQEKSGEKVATFDQLFDFLAKELWFPHFARNVEINNHGSNSKEYFDYRNKPAYHFIVKNWVEEFLDMSLFSEVRGPDHGDELYGRYVLRFGMKYQKYSDRNQVKSFWKGSSNITGIKHFDNLYNFLNDNIRPNALQFKIAGPDKKISFRALEHDGAVMKHEDVRKDDVIKQTEAKRDTFLENAPVYMFRQYYFSVAKEAFPQSSLELNDERNVDNFVDFICNRFAAAYKEKEESGQKAFSYLPAMGENLDARFTQSMPDFANFSAVSAQLTCLAMQNLYQLKAVDVVGGQVNETSKFETNFWQEILLKAKRNETNIAMTESLDDDIKDYVNKRWYNFFTSREKLAAKYQQLQVNSTIEELAEFVKYLYGLHEVSKIYAQSKDSEQQLYGRVYEEIVRLYGQRLEQTVVNLEARMKVPQFAPDNLEAAMFTVQSLMNRTILPEQMRVLQATEDHGARAAGALEEAHAAMTGDIGASGVEFEEKLRVSREAAALAKEKGAEEKK